MTEKDGDRVTLLAWAKAWSKNSHLLDVELGLIAFTALDQGDRALVGRLPRNPR
jgi:hypothetical protein